MRINQNGDEPYKFGKQLEKGKEVEFTLDLFFSEHHGVIIRHATREQERRGIDRLFVDRRGVLWRTIEYKADFKSAETGNAYVETVSVGTYDGMGTFVVRKEGWALTCCADRLVYYPVGLGVLYVLDPLDLRALVQKDSMSRASENGKALYRSVTTRNAGYQGRGLLVPLPEIEHIAKRTLEIGE